MSNTRKNRPAASPSRMRPTRGGARAGHRAVAAILMGFARPANAREGQFDIEQMVQEFAF